MKDISFYDYGLEDIFCGRKSSTLRFNESGYSPGEIIKLVRQNGQFVGFLKILSVKSVKFSELTEVDAFIENWTSIEDLKTRLLFSYKTLTPNDLLTRITFSYLTKVPDVLRKNSTPKSKVLNDITIFTDSAEKFIRYSKIFKDFFNMDSVQRSPLKIENIFEMSCEQRAKEKLLLSGDTFSFAADDMATISLPNEVIQISNLKDLKENICNIEDETFDITIRTGMALKLDGAVYTHPVLRTFNAKKAEYTSLNDILFLENSPISSYRSTDKILIQPIIDGISVLLKGGL